ncbi:Mobile element protein [Collimonas arenae]|uniref:Mobile element protein n=1 Tax=Collimonas arenae TaxID=279058 RepID=A0A0A1FGV1_9BURK|nr:transposase [Collimonas arenae]AIY42950.1 Mobile element protein [Collimonas arenae]
MNGTTIFTEKTTIFTEKFTWLTSKKIMKELRDDQWQKLAPMLHGKDGDPGAKGRNNRLFINAVLWISSEKRQWIDIPLHFGNWNTVYMRFRRWNEDGNWHKLAVKLQDDPELSALFGDIARYGEQCYRQLKNKTSRRSSREIYQNHIKHAVGKKLRGQEEDDSTLHWLRLVSG